MIMEQQGDVVDAVLDVLDDSNLSLDDLIEPMVFVLTDMIAQLTDYEYHGALLEDILKLIKHGVERHCLIAAEADTITIN